MDFLAYIIVPLLLGLWAQWKVKATFNRWKEVGSRSGATGKEAAEAILRAEGITGVKIEPVDGFLSDHYDPSSRTLRLSGDNFAGTSVAALGVAAHEAGHAIQHARAYAPLRLRSFLVPVTIVANQVAFWILMLGAFVFTQGGGAGNTMLNIAIGAYAVVTVFTLVTLPVEFDASARANRALVAAGFLDREESKGAKEVLDAAAWTYIAAFVAALGNLLWLLSRREE
jgi:hypothetical protein